MAESLTVQRLSYSPLLQTINALAGVLQSVGLTGRLEEQALLRAAERRAGLRDWGEDAALRTALRGLLEHLQAAPVTPLGRINAQQAIIKAAINRLRIVAYLQQHPAVRETPIQRPIFILGFPRTGTTLLQNLLDLHPARRALRFWELVSPVPIHADPDVDARRRLRQAEQLLSLAYVVAPEMKYVHEIRATTAEECWPLFFNAFSAMNYDLTASLRGFGAWLMAQDMTGAYADYRTQLQIMAQRQPGTDFVLKCPEHLWFLDALLAVFPDACIVWTHRDPLACVASYCSLTSLQQRLLYGVVDPVRLGEHITDRFRLGVERAMAARDRHPDQSRFFDVDFQALTRDPTAMLRRIHDHFSLEWPDDMAARIQAWQDNDRSDKRGRHRYSAELYGLDAARIDRDFAPYISRFSIPLKR